MDQLQEDYDYLRTSTKEEFLKTHKTQITDDDLTLFSGPRKGCHHCYGRGYEGYWSKDSIISPGQPAVCRCVLNSVFRKTKTNLMTYGEYKELLSMCRKVYNLEEPHAEIPVESDKAPLNEVGNISSEGGARKDSNDGDGKDIYPQPS